MNTTPCPQPPGESFDNKPRVIVLKEELEKLERELNEYKEKVSNYHGYLYGCNKHRLWQGMSCIGCIEEERDQLRTENRLESLKQSSCGRRTIMTPDELERSERTGQSKEPVTDEFVREQMESLYHQMIALNPVGVVREIDQLYEKIKQLEQSSREQVELIERFLDKFKSLFLYTAGPNCLVMENIIREALSAAHAQGFPRKK